MKWLQVELTVSGELAEPVAELLSRHVPDGVSLTAAWDEGKADAERVTVRGYLPVDAELNQRRKAIDEGLWHLSRIQPLPQARYQPIEDQDWSELWKRRWQPLEVGRRFLILPAWLEAQETERLLIRMDPGMAFGTGTHPSTQLCIEWLEACLEPDDLLVDLGCGSGILSIAGVLLGARRALALDIDTDAVAATRANAELNRVEGSIEVELGSLAALLEEEPSRPCADVLVANILAPVLQDMLRSGLAEAVGPGTRLILGGVLAEQSDQLAELARDHNLQLVGQRAQGDWRALCLKRNPLPG